LLGYPSLRRAHIPTPERDLFDRIGETGLQLVLAGGFHPKSQELSAVYTVPVIAQHAQDWLTERADIRARHEWRMERVEWAVLIFVILGVVVDCVLAFQSVLSK
jgi:hypothetical protein